MLGQIHPRITIGAILSLILLLVLGCVPGSFDIGGNQQTSAESAKILMTAYAEQTQKALSVPAELPLTVDPGMQATQVALAVQGTTVALQAEALTQVAVQQAQQPAPQPQNPPAAQQNPPAVQENPPAQPAGAQAQPEPTAKPSLEPFDTWKTKASILLYEDMVGMPDANRTVKDAFEALGLKITKDDKDASGFFLSDIRSGGPGGKPWDLIVSASEARTAVQGEFIPPLNEAVTKGSALIMEQWNIDSINLGKISTLLMRCGVSFQHDLSVNPGDCLGPADENFLVLWAIDGSSPILHEPNEGLRISSMAEYWTDWYSHRCALGLWADDWDYGDLLQVTDSTKATVVLGTKSTETDRYATLVSCTDGRVILWTSSTHNYSNDRVLPLWMNIIHNALKARYDYLSKQ